MNIREIEEAGQKILELLNDYRRHPAKRRELEIDETIYAYLQGRFGNITRQHYVHLQSKPRPQRIDFRCGGSNPVVIELAVRPPDGHQQLYGSQNVSELRKLTRIVASQARTRVLLLLDLADPSIPCDKLKPTYDSQNAGPGNFDSYPVRVVYVHHELTYHFLWSPRSSNG